MAAKYQRIADALKDDIRSGRLVHQDRLPGESDLADRFEVSRGTVRQALASLQADGLITTWTGSGSYVSYDGAQLDEGLGWSEALARHGVHTRSRLLTLGRAELPELADRLELDDATFLLVERVRHTEAGHAISLERSRVPWQRSFETVLATGLVDGSLQATLLAHGLHSAQGEETIGVAVLGSDDAGVLGRTPGESFLYLDRTTRDAFGVVVEHVRSLLHPHHFQLQHRFGAAR